MSYLLVVQVFVRTPLPRSVGQFCVEINRLNIPGIGQGKGERDLEWMCENEATLGLRVGTHVARRRSELTLQALSFVVPAATAVVPYEKFLVPLELDGSRGRCRAAVRKVMVRGLIRSALPNCHPRRKRSVALQRAPRN